MPALFQNRQEGGRRLAATLARYAGRPDVLVLALPRGGVPVAFEIARSLHAPLDVLLVRKLGVPGHTELAMGAIGSGGIRILNEEVIRLLRIPPETINAVAQQEARELERRNDLYRHGMPPVDVGGRTVILIDDGLATGSTMRAAVATLKVHHPARLVIAVPVAAADTCLALRGEVDEVVCLEMPEPFYAVGAWYDDFSQTTDDEIQQLLELAREADSEHQPARAGGEESRE